MAYFLFFFFCYCKSQQKQRKYLWNVCIVQNVILKEILSVQFKSLGTKRRKQAAVDEGSVLMPLQRTAIFDWKTSKIRVESSRVVSSTLTIVVSVLFSQLNYCQRYILHAARCTLQAGLEKKKKKKRRETKKGKRKKTEDVICVSWYKAVGLRPVSPAKRPVYI